jgi:hypothetical protein
MTDDKAFELVRARLHMARDSDPDWPACSFCALAHVAWAAGDLNVAALEGVPVTTMEKAAADLAATAIRFLVNADRHSDRCYPYRLYDPNEGDDE